MPKENREKKETIIVKISSLSKENLRIIAKRKGVSMTAIIEMALRGEIDLKGEIERMEEEK